MVQQGIVKRGAHQKIGRAGFIIAASVVSAVVYPKLLELIDRQARHMAG